MPSCIVTGTIVDVGGQAVSGAVVAVRNAATGNRVQFVGGAAVGGGEATAQTNGDGQFSLALEQGADVVIRIDELGLHKRVTVPAVADATLEELLNADV